MQACAILVLASCHVLFDICAAANNAPIGMNSTTTSTTNTTSTSKTSTSTTNTTSTSTTSTFTTNTTSTSTTSTSTTNTTTTSNTSTTTGNSTGNSTTTINGTVFRTTTTTSQLAVTTVSTKHGMISSSAINASNTSTHEGFGMMTMKAAPKTNTTTNTTSTSTTSTLSTTTRNSSGNSTTTINGTVFRTTTTTTQLAVYFRGTISIKATGLTTTQVEMSAKKAIAQEFSVAESQVTVTATESRRLQASAVARKLAGNWAVSFTVETVYSNRGALEGAADRLKTNSVSVQTKMKKALTDMGVDASSLKLSGFDMYLVVVPTTTVCFNCTVTTTNNASMMNATLMDVVDPTRFHNLTNATLQLDLGPNATFSTTRTTTTEGTTLEFLGFQEGNTTTTLYQWTTVTTTTTTTTGKPCDVPFDPNGKYLEQPWSYGDNTSWRLYCNDSFISANGLTLASCIGNGVLRPAGRCRKSGCKQAQVPWDRRFHTCPPHLGEGETCGATCNPKSHEQAVGHWTCIRGVFRGMPSCLNSEAKYYQLSWVLPKVAGSYNFAGELMRWVNMSNDTISGFQTDVLNAFAGSLVGIDAIPTFFKVFEVHHLWQSSNIYHVDTGEILNWARSHLFSVNYEFIVWDVNTLQANEEAVREILRRKSRPWQLFADQMRASANLTLLELYPTTWPMAYNETVLAPDVEESPTGLATSHWIDARLVILLIAVSSFLP